MKCRMDHAQREALMEFIRRTITASVHASQTTQKAQEEAEERFHDLFADEMEGRAPTEWETPRGTLSASEAPKVWNRRYPGVPEDAVSIERGTPWGNPYRVELYGRKEAIALFREQVESNPVLRERIQSALRGRHLVCCCKPKLCHGDVLLEVANR